MLEIEKMISEMYGKWIGHEWTRETNISSPLEEETDFPKAC